MALFGKIIGAFRNAAKKIFSFNPSSGKVTKEKSPVETSISTGKEDALQVPAPIEVQASGVAAHEIKEQCSIDFRAISTKEERIKEPETKGKAIRDEKKRESHPIAEFKDIQIINSEDGGYKIEADGSTYTLFQFAKRFGIKFSTLYGRVHKGWDIQEVIQTSREVNRDYKKDSPIKAKLWEWKGEKHTVEEWAKIYGVQKAMMRKRLHEHGSPERNTEKLEAYKANRARIYEWNGEKHTIKEWATIYNVPERTMHGRLTRSGSPEHIPNSVIPEVAKQWKYNGESHTIAEWAKIVGKSKSTVRHNFKISGSPFLVPKERTRTKRQIVGIERTYTWKGVTKTTSEWAKEYNCTVNAVRKRFKATGSPEESGKKCTAHLFTFNGETHTYKEWGEKYGISAKRMYKRIKTHGTPELPLSQKIETKINTPYIEADKSSSPLKVQKGELYGCDGEWKTIGDWATDFGISETLVKENFDKYGTPIEPELEIGDDYGEETESEMEIDEILKEVDAEQSICSKQKSSIRESIDKILDESDDERPLREILGLEQSQLTKICGNILQEINLPSKDYDAQEVLRAS